MRKPEIEPPEETAESRLERVRLELERISQNLKGTAEAYDQESELRRRQAPGGP
jgi:hypothetical protein